MTERLELYESESGTRVGEAEIVDQKLRTPSSIDGWKDVLDCRHAPYTEQSIEEICEFAAHVRKPYVLVHADKTDEE